MERPINLIVRRFAEKGGAEMAFFHFAKYLLEKNVNFRIICGVDRVNDDRFKHCTTEIGIVNFSRYTKRTSFYNRAGSAVKGLDGVLFAFDVVPEAHILRNAASLSAIWRKDLLKGLSPIKKGYKIAHDIVSPARIFTDFSERKFYNNSSLRRIIVDSECLKEEIASRYPSTRDKIAIVHKGVDKEAFSMIEPTLREKTRKYHGISDDAVLIGFASNDHKRKGLKFILDALELLPENYILLVVGKENNRKYKRHKMAHKVIFTGYADGMRNFYAPLDVFCLPSLCDIGPRVVFEALSCGIPVITSKSARVDVGFIENGKNGYMLETFEPKEIAEKILELSKSTAVDHIDNVTDSSATYQKYLEIAQEVMKTL